MRWYPAIVAAALLTACHAATQLPIEGPVEAQVSYADQRGRYDLYHIRLAAGGEAATGQLLRPRHGKGPFPAVLLNDGRELNSAALQYLPVEFGDVVVLSLDYPERIPYELDFTLLTRSGEIRRELRRIPRLFSLGAAYLAEREDVDPYRTALVVTSFAVPFGVIAAAEDARFRNVGLVYGAGNIGHVIAANLDLTPRFVSSMAGWLVVQLYGEFDPTPYIGRIAPRPVLMVNGEDDPQIPVDAVRALFAAAGKPKEIVWLQTGHLMPTDTALIRELVDTTLVRLPVLEGVQHQEVSNTLRPSTSLGLRPSYPTLNIWDGQFAAARARPKQTDSKKRCRARGQSGGTVRDRTLHIGGLSARR